MKKFITGMVFLTLAMVSGAEPAPSNTEPTQPPAVTVAAPEQQTATLQQDQPAPKAQVEPVTQADKKPQTEAPKKKKKPLVIKWRDF